ncbi:MAG: hypothetical protein ABFR89_12885 [Actinomycetota bacterium]
MRRLTVLLIAVAMLAAGCSSATTTTTTTTPTTATTTTTTTAATSSTTTTPTTAAESSEDPLVLVAFGDSLINHANADLPLIGVYADMLEEEFGVPLDVRDFSRWSSSPTDLLTALDTERVQTGLSEADVVLLEIPQAEQAIFMTATGWQGRDPADCGGDDNQQCLRDYVTANKASVEEIFARITAICDPAETLIRSLTMYQMDVEARKPEDALDVTIPYFTEAQENLEVIAAGYGIPVADVYHEFMGPDGTNDPRDRELLLVDQRHPSEKGAKLIAGMLDDLGYDYAD